MLAFSKPGNIIYIHYFPSDFARESDFELFLHVYLYDTEFKKMTITIINDAKILMTVLGKIIINT